MTQIDNRSPKIGRENTKYKGANGFPLYSSAPKAGPDVQPPPVGRNEPALFRPLYSVVCCAFAILVQWQIRADRWAS